MYSGVDLNDKQLEQIYNKIDIDGSGQIDYSEFVVASMNEKQILSQEKLKAAFDMFDFDGSGTISQEELKEVLSLGTNIDQLTIDKIFLQADANGDGQISFNEFI